MEVIVATELMVCDNGVVDATGAGFTSTVAVTGAPAHPLAVGVMVNVTVAAAPVVLANDPVMLPVPDAAMPVIVVLCLVQL